MNYNTIPTILETPEEVSELLMDAALYIQKLQSK